MQQCVELLRTTEGAMELKAFVALLKILKMHPLGG